MKTWPAVEQRFGRALGVESAGRNDDADPLIEHYSGSESSERGRRGSARPSKFFSVLLLNEIAPQSLDCPRSNFGDSFSA